MNYKSDWEQAKKRFEAFWDGGEIIGRCCVSIKAYDNKKYSPVSLLI